MGTLRRAFGRRYALASRWYDERRRAAIVRRHLRLPELPRTGGLWAVTLVRDEADMIGHAVDHLLDQGVSRILAVDHLSSDATPQILEERGDRVTVVPYRHPAYAQSGIMTALARQAGMPARMAPSGLYRSTLTRSGRPSTAPCWPNTCSDASKTSLRPIW